MNTYRHLAQRLFALGLILVAAACGTHKTAPATDDTAEFQPQIFIRQMAAPAVKPMECVTSKLKFSVTVGSQNLSIGGQLKMKRNDVIRIQLMALGIMEAGRLEFTPDYVLMMDRINKQYVKASYDDVEFLRQSGINFYTLQALFAGELFEPGRQTPDPGSFSATRRSDAVVVSLEAGQLSYQWQADPHTALIRQTDITHREAQLVWDYSAYKNVERRQLPSDMEVSVKTSRKEFKAGFQLSQFSTDADWESRTTISSKYKQVTVDDILKRLISL